MSDAAASLAAFLAGQFDDPDEEARTGFRIESDRHAVWAFRRLARIRADLDHVKEVAAGERATIAEWEDAEAARIGRDVSLFEGALADYWRRELGEQLAEHLAAGLPFDEAWAKIKSKSRKLSHGTLSASKGRDSVVVDDEPAFVAWAGKHAPQVLVPKVVPSKDRILAELTRSGTSFVDADGARVPGVHIENPGVTYKATPA